MSPSNNATGYPITSPKQKMISMRLSAVAGFKKADIEIELEDGTSKSNINNLDGDEIEYLHKGIAERNFQELSKLAEHVEVKEAQVRGRYFESFLCLETYLMS